MKINIYKSLFFLILIQIFSTQGIITFNIFKFFGNWELKSLVHPFGVILTVGLILVYIFKRGTLKINSLDILFFGYCFIILTFLVINTSFSLSNIYLSFRDVFLIYFLILLYSQIEIPETLWVKILRVIFYLVILNIGFIILTHILGPEDYMMLMTGKYVWSNDPVYKFKISSFNIFWRSPGLIGSPGNVGYFGLIAYFLFDQNKQFKNKRIFAIVLAIMGFVRSVYVALVVYWVFKFFLTKKNIKILKYGLPYVALIVILIINFLYRKGVLNLTSLFMRIDHWVNDIDVDYNILFGGGIGLVGSAVRGEGFSATLDNYWLLMLISAGIIGIVFAIAFLYEKALDNTKLKYVLMGLFATGFFITITQSMAFIVLFPLLFMKTSKQTIGA